MMRRGTAANEEIVNRANYLLDGAALTNQQLHALRGHNLLTQAGLLLGGVALLCAALVFEDVLKSGAAVGLLLYTARLARLAETRLRAAILATCEDVNYWQEKLICLENELPEQQRYFTEFKLVQKNRSAAASYVDHLRGLFLQQRTIDSSDARRLVERGSGHYHWPLEETLPDVFHRVWWGLIWVGVGYVVLLVVAALL